MTKYATVFVDKTKVFESITKYIDAIANEVGVNIMTYTENSQIYVCRKVGVTAKSLKEEYRLPDDEIVDSFFSFTREACKRDFGAYALEPKKGKKQPPVQYVVTDASILAALYTQREVGKLTPVEIDKYEIKVGQVKKVQGRRMYTTEISVPVDVKTMSKSQIAERLICLGKISDFTDNK